MMSGIEKSKTDFVAFRGSKMISSTPSNPGLKLWIREQMQAIHELSGLDRLVRESQYWTGFQWHIDLWISISAVHLIKVILLHHFVAFMHSALRLVPKSGSILIFSWKLSISSVLQAQPSLHPIFKRLHTYLRLLNSPKFWGGSSKWFDNKKEMWTETRLPGSTAKMNDMMYSSTARVCINSMRVTRSVYRPQHPKRSREL